jgi:uncharacterized membrane protein
MSSDPLDLPPTAARLFSLARSRYLTPQALDYALHLMGLLPHQKHWRRFINHFLLFLGSALLLVGIIFLFAFNWAEMTRVAKFSLLQISMLIMATVATWQGLKSISGQMALLAATVLVGVLLAVFGQIYQTGADSYELFLIWAILIIPWVLISAFAPLWLLLLTLFNLSLILYWQQIINPSFSQPITGLFLWLFLLNGFAMAAWEFAAWKKIDWLNGQWLGRLLFTVTLIMLVIPTCEAILHQNWLQNWLFLFTVVLYLLFTTSTLWYYRLLKRDLLLLSVNLFGIIVVTITFVAQLLSLENSFSWLILALVIVGQATLATKWLQRTAYQWFQEENK